MIKPVNYLLNIIKKLSSITVAGGLSVNDSSIRYLRLEDDGRISTASLRLPPGIIEGGRVKDKEMAKNALSQLRAMIKPEKGVIEVVLSLESGVAYSQFFNLPQLETAGLKEAAELNIQMISPINISQAYYGYQMIGESAGGIGYEFLGGFAPSVAVDDWISVLREVEMLPVAVEFNSLSVVRAFASESGFDKKATHLGVDVSSEGLDIMLIKNGNLYFDYFYSWKAIQGEDRTISFEKMKSVVTAETGKVMNFSLSRFGSEVKKVVVNAGTIGDKVIDTVRGQFPGVSVSRLDVKKPGISSSWMAAYGAALRGMISRSEDDLITLSPLTVIEEQSHRQVLNMITTWGKVFIGIFVFMVFISGVSDLFLRRARIDLGRQSIRGLSGNEAVEFSRLSSRAAEYNQLITLVAQAKTGEAGISSFLEKVSGLNPDVRLTRLSIPAIISPVSINGIAPSADAVSRFNRQLALIPGVSEINFPLSSLVNNADGTTSFIMSFKVASFKVQ